MRTEIKPEIDHVPENCFKQYAAANYPPSSQNHRSALGRFLTGLGLPNVDEVLNRYGVRPTKNYRYDGLLGTAFIQRDINGVIRNVKEMAYKDDGHRVRDGEECEVWDARQHRYVSRKDGGYDGTERPTISLKAKRIMWQHEFVGSQCLFGEHLLPSNPDRPVMVVESEKSASIGAMIHPDRVWVATGGKYGCRLYDPGINKTLNGREVILCPDLGAEAEWESVAESMANEGIDVSILSLEDAGFVTDEDREAGLDIADYFVRVWKQEHPELVEQQSTEPSPVPKIKRANAPEIMAALSKLYPAPVVAPHPTTATQTPQGTSLNEDGGIGFFEIDLDSIN